MYIIVVGAGRTGRKVIELATRDEHEVVVIERDQSLAEEASATFDCRVINEDAASKAILLEAGIESADAILSTTETDSVNLMISMLGKQYGVDALVSSINDPQHRELFSDLGVNAVESPHELNGEYLYRAVQLPSVEDFMQVAGKAEIFEITVDEGSPIDGLSLRDADEKDLLPEETIIVALIRDDELLIPRGNTAIKAGDLVTLFTRKGVQEWITDPFTSA